MTCLICGGLKPEPGRAYGYSGKLCHCSNYNPIHTHQSQYTDSQEMIRLLRDILEELKEVNERLTLLRMAI
jgi:hypothetical protein